MQTLFYANFILKKWLKKLNLKYVVCKIITKKYDNSAIFYSFLILIADDE